MTTPTHDPLKQAHIALLNSAPFEITVGDHDTDKYKSVSYLSQAGYLTPEQTHVSEDVLKGRFRYTRTAKPLP